MLYLQNGDRIVTIDSVTSLHSASNTSCNWDNVFSGVTMGWLLRLVAPGGPTGGMGPPTVLEFLVINFSVCLVLLSNCYIITYCIVFTDTEYIWH